MDKLLSVNEVAKQLAVDPETVYRWIRDGDLKVFRAGGLWRIKQDDVEVFLKSNQRPL